MTVIAEYKTVELPGVALDEADRRLCARLREGQRLLVDELVGGLRVGARAWVGVVQLSEVRLEIVPKLAGEHLGLLRMLDWTTGLDALRDIGGPQRLELEGASLLDLVALLLVQATERIARDGLRTAYVEEEETLGVLRGRLVLERQLRRRHGRLDRLECRFDERSADIFDNQLLLAAAERCATRVRHGDTRRRAARLRMMLADVCDARQVALPRRELHYDRLNRRYAAAHELAWLVLEGTHGLDDLYRSGATRSFAFMLDMNRLFEHFVERVLREALRTHRVGLRFQALSGSVVRRADGGPYMNLIPDVLAAVGQPAVNVPIDAKYKRYSGKRLDREDVAQAFVYASGLGDADRPCALIVYPAESGELEITPLTIRNRGQTRAALTALGVPVTRILDEVVLGAPRPTLDAIAFNVLAAESTDVRV